MGCLNIEIHQPELQALINERMSTGLFRTVEDMLRQALEDSAVSPELAPEVEKPNFTEFLKNSPLWGSGLTVTRSKDLPRTVVL